jgi:hypothetical protein
MSKSSFDDCIVEYSLHVLIKLDLLGKHGFSITKEDILSIVKQPDKLEFGYKNRFIAQKRIDDERVLRIVYEKHEDNKILIITVYPGRRSRYEEN